MKATYVLVFALAIYQKLFGNFDLMLFAPIYLFTTLFLSILYKTIKESKANEIEEMEVIEAPKKSRKKPTK